uniref:Uncharacterized protein n=1 Tax=Fagus sylvatica TaxID=28930 RepID=A0A2N9I1V7_FAGSY
MSLSQKSTELENITGWEIQPYVPKPVVDFCQDDGLHTKLYKALRKMITRSTALLRQLPVGQNEHGTTNGAVEAVPISFKVPEDCENNVTVNTGPLQKRERTSTSLVGEISVSFKLPDDCAINAQEVDKMRFPVPQDGDPKDFNTQNVHQFSFSERLEGWKITRRKRNTGRFDVYYHHEKSCRVFRSTVEVVNFLLYEVYPDKLQKEKKVGESEVDNSAPKSEHKRGILKRKQTSPILSESSSKSKKKMRFSSDIGEKNKTKTVKEKTMKETVEEFLDAAYKNISKSSMDYGCEQKEYTGFSSVTEEKITREMVEEFLDTAYKNLLNHFNEEENVPNGNGKETVEEPKDEGKSKVAISPDSASANPIQEQENPAKMQTNPVEVNNNPAQVEDNTAGTSSTSAYNEQLDLINHIPYYADVVFFLYKEGQNNGEI